MKVYELICSDYSEYLFIQRFLSINRKKTLTYNQLLDLAENIDISDSGSAPYHNYSDIDPEGNKPKSEMQYILFNI